MNDDNMTVDYYNLAKNIISRKNVEDSEILKAIEYLDKVLEKDEKSLDALYAMAAAHKKLGNYQTALELLEKLIEIEPDAINARAFRKLLLQKYL